MSIIKGTDTIVAGFGGTKRSIGEVYFSQSSLATDNSGALPLFTGETITSANTIYPDFYNWVSAHTELQCTSAEYESALSTYGECPKYVVSSGSLRLPKLSNYIKAANTAEGITQSKAGLPTVKAISNTAASNVSGWASLPPYAKGVQNTQGYSLMTGSSISVSTALAYVENDASLDSSVYGASETVTPAHTTLYPWVVAYAAAIPASTAQAAEFQQGLSGKADTNLANLSTAGKSLVSGLGMPSNRYIDLTLGANGSTYTAPANGYFCLKGNGGINGNFKISFYNKTANFIQSVSDNNWADWVSTYIPAKKGDVVQSLYTNVTASSHRFLFIYAEGAE